MVYNGVVGGHFSDLAENVDRVVTMLEPHLRKFDSIAVRGVSGQSVGFPVSLRLGKPIVVVRKPFESRHAIQPLVGARDLGKRVLFLDDLISSGQTLAEVRRAVEEHGSTLVGSVLYADNYVEWKRYRRLGRPR